MVNVVPNLSPKIYSRKKSREEARSPSPVGGQEAGSCTKAEGDRPAEDCRPHYFKNVRLVRSPEMGADYLQGVHQ